MNIHNEPHACESNVRRTVIDKVAVTIEAILGAARISIGELQNLEPGDTFAVDRLLGDAIELRLNGEPIAYGELVFLGKHFAVRIKDIAGA